MPVLLDTNILLRLLQPHHPHSAIAERALSILRGRDEMLNIAAQNIVEFWAVTTRPVVENGLGFTAEQAMTEIEAMKRLFRLLPEIPLQAAWEHVVTTYRVSGKSTHDARLVAAMMVNDIGTILTFNVQDFARYQGISVLNPSLLVQSLET